MKLIIASRFFFKIFSLVAFEEISMISSTNNPILWVWSLLTVAVLGPSLFLVKNFPYLPVLEV